MSYDEPRLPPVNKPSRPRASRRSRLTGAAPSSAAFAAVLLAALLLKACADEAPTAPEPGDLPAAGAMGTNADGTRIVIDPHWLTLDTVGVTGWFSATVIDAAGDTLAAKVAWASADTTIATINAWGRVNSVAFGKTKVTATYDSATAEATVEVALRLSDREILEILYEATGGDEWTDNTNWLSDEDLDEWYGVSARQGKVSYLLLAGNNLVGTIPPEIGGLDVLLILRLNDNRLSGTIPAELSKFNRLRDMILDSNELEGRLPPELGYTGGLEYLTIDQNNISGPIPFTFSNLELTQFYFDRDGPCVPADLEEWLNTVPQKEDLYQLCTDELVIAPDSLYFEAPPLGDTARLSAAVINATGDTVPDASITWTSADTSVATVDSTGLVTSVHYGATQVTAASDSLTATVDVKVVFTLSDRQILDTLYRVTGGESWTDTTNWLSDQPLSDWYGVEANEEGNVVGLSLGGNNLTGSIPELIGELGDLATLDLARNALAGRIPWQLGRLEQLRDLLLNDNALEGLLPFEMGKLDSLRYLHIGDNNLSGVVPRRFADLQLDTLFAAGSGVCVPPSLDRWLAGIERTDSVDRCAASIAIEVVDLPSLTFYWPGETATLSATYVDAEGDTTYEAPVAWSSGADSIATVDASGTVTAVGAGTTDVTATYDSTTGSIEVVVDLPENDRDVLAILHDRAGGGGWTDGTNWLTDEPLSEWAGVETDDSGRVVGLSLSDNNLRGPIHSSIGRLDQLVTLDLGRNWLTGPIPVELGDLSLLRELVLRVNGLVGELPAELGALDSLRTVNLAVTSVSGLVPASFADLELENFLINGSELCVPPSLAGWLESIHRTDDPPVCASRLTISPSAVTFGALGDTIRLAAMVVGPEGGAVDSPAVAWASGDTTIATVDTTGLLTARDIGAVTVTATHDSATTGAVDVAVRPPGSDRVALEAFYHATGGDDWTNNTNWLSDQPLEEWHGVRGVTNGRVDNLSLGNNNLTGHIPAAIGLLDTLFILDLRSNSLAGPIPRSIGRLTRLRDLILSSNEGINGPLPPEMGNMAGLSYLTVANTSLTGPLPETFAGLAVERFYDWGTGLCVPRSLAAWYESTGNSDPLPCIPKTADRDVLVTLYNETGGPEWDGSQNWLSDGSLNTWRGIQTDAEGYVTEIFLPWNNLTDSIPAEVGDLHRLEVLSLYGNDLTGRIPPEIGKLTALRYLAVSSNELEGPIPPEIGNLVNVVEMWLSGNKLSGPIPPEFGNLESLEFLAIFENELSGPLPAEMGNLKNLKTMWAVDNKFEGPLPPEMGDMTSLEDLSLGRNRITGALPPEWGRFQALKSMSLSKNELTGPIPPELGTPLPV